MGAANCAGKSASAAISCGDPATPSARSGCGVPPIDESQHFCTPLPLRGPGSCAFPDLEPLNALPWDLADPWIEYRRLICVVGMPGVGKSCLGDLLIGADGALAESSRCRPEGLAQPCGVVDFEHHFKLGDVCYRVMDTAGLRGCPSERGPALAEPDLAPNGIDCFLYVCQWDATFEREQFEAFQSFEETYGPEALAFTIFAFTHLADLTDEEMRARLEGSNTPQALRVCVQKAGGARRAVGVDAKSPDERQREEQRAVVLHAVDELVRSNAFMRYTNGHIRRAREWRTAVEREAKMLPSPEREALQAELLALLRGRSTRAQVEETLASSRREVTRRRLLAETEGGGGSGGAEPGMSSMMRPSPPSCSRCAGGGLPRPPSRKHSEDGPPPDLPVPAEPTSVPFDVRRAAPIRPTTVYL